MLTIKYESSFRKDFKRIVKRGYDIGVWQSLPEKYKDHSLNGIYKDCRECHITPDWLLIYQINDNELILYLTRTGTHSDLF